MLVTSGSYTGDGTDGKGIAVGWQPSLVVVKQDGATEFVVRTSTMGADETKPSLEDASALTSNLIQSFTATGFTVGDDAAVNSNGATYYWTAWQVDSDDMAVYSYTGTGSGTNHTHASVGFTPELAWVIPAGTASMYWRSDQHPANESQRFNATATTGAISAFVAGGISVGATTINSGGATYHAVVWKKVAAVLATAAYNGDGSDNRNIAHGLGATPIFALVQCQNVAVGSAAIRFADQVGDLSFLTGSAADAANHIQAMDGTNVQVGTSNNVNRGVSAPPYTLVVFGELVPSTPIITSITPDTGPTSGGTSVTIEGTDFQSGATITIGGASATGVTFVDATEITAVTPAGAAGAQDVVITNPDTGTDALEGGFTYEAVEGSGSLLLLGVGS